MNRLMKVVGSGAAALALVGCASVAVAVPGAAETVTTVEVLPNGDVVTTTTETVRVPVSGLVPNPHPGVQPPTIGSSSDSARDGSATSGTSVVKTPGKFKVTKTKRAKRSVRVKGVKFSARAKATRSATAPTKAKAAKAAKRAAMKAAKAKALRKAKAKARAHR